MAPGCSKTLITTSKSRRHNSLASHPHFFLLASCLLLTLSIHVGATRVAAAISLGELGLEQTSSGRRFLAQRPAPNGTQSLQEDAEALLQIKDAITFDPNKITYWWKPQGEHHVLNPCKIRNGTKQYWPGIDCSPDKRVTGIDLSNMGLQGTLSPILGALSRLKHLNFSNNFFSGSIPMELGKATSLETLDLGNNRLEGEFPPTVGDVMRNLTSLAVGNNRLGGTIPSSLGNLSFLATLNMSVNNFTGGIPPELNSCRILVTVDFSRNGLLQGEVPFRNLENLTTLHLQNNQLEGDFVQSYLGSFPRLEDVDLSNNNLIGMIPSSVGVLPLTTQLSVAHNKLTGAIPNELGDLSLVQKIDFSANQFTGTLPDSVPGLLSLREFDISENQFTGDLPINLMFLTSLQTLNVSHNEFNGSLPTLEGISTLQKFDASYNNLTGGIPQNFVNLSAFSSMVYLNVSYNDLSGAVPLFVEHDDVNGNSFLHNVGLCGPNIVGQNSCGSSSSDATSKIVSISVGCSVAVAAVMVAVIVCRRKRNNVKGRSSASVSAEFEMELEAEDILRMTENFTTVIGVGSMSTVYRGVATDGTVVAVKRFGIRMGEIDAAAEKVLADGFETLGNVRHWTAVKVVGYCCTPELKALVMEHLSNGTLSNLLYPTLHTDVVRDFNWDHRFNAAIVIAQGLKHLHHECQPSTVHGDLKPSNILFNTFMEARIADFGVRELLGNHGLRGDASGYMAPEVTTKGTIKGDVYSFGIIVLEMITGRSPNSLEQGQRLPEWIRETISNSKSLQNVLDPILMGELRVQQQRMAMVLGVALLCTREDPLQRPYITEVIKMLNHIKTRPQDGSRGGRSSSRRLRTSLSTHQRNEEIRQEVPEIEISRSDPPTPSALPANPSLSHWTPSAEDR